MDIDPPIKCKHCGSELYVASVSNVYILLCPKMGIIEHPNYIYEPTIEVR